jgi:hypothetical protein
VLAIEPHPCRPATGRSSWTRHVPGLAVAVRRASEIAGLRAELVVAGNVVRRRAASSCAPGYQEVAPGERGEAARALGTAVASACPRVLRAWPSAGQAVREAAATRLGIGVVFDPSSPSSCVLTCVKSGFVSCGFLQENGAGVVPRCAGGGEFEPSYRVDAPHAERENADACPAGAPQRRVATRARDSVARDTLHAERTSPVRQDFGRTLGGHVNPAQER